ncbi:MAG: DUF1573 domain-containing protein [Planctomycetaceae bacterium]
MLLTAGSLVALIAVPASLTNVVQFAPDGVPLARRAEYDAKVAQIALKNRGLTSDVPSTRPIATIKEREFDFGLLDPHSTASHVFQIRNTGSENLVLESIGSSCKCTVSSVDGDSIAPGKSGYVTVTWNTGYQSESYVQSALIKTNDPLRPEIELSVRGSVRAELVLGIDTLPMPDADRGKLAESSTFLYSQLWEDFRIESATSDLPGFQWSVDPLPGDALPVADLQASSAWRLNIMTVGQHVGPYKGNVKLIIVPMSGGEPVERELAVEGRVRAPIAFTHEAIDGQKGLDLGLITRGKEFSRSLIVRVRDEQVRQIDVLDIEPKALQASLAPTRQRGAYRLTITLSPEAALTAFNRPAQHGFVQVGDRQDPSFHNWLPLYGAVINPPATQ